MTDNKEEWKPRFFRETEHPYVEDVRDIRGNYEDNPIIYRLIENEGDHKGYWERRERNDWDD